MASNVAYVELVSFLQVNFNPIPVLDFDSIDDAQEQDKVQFICLEEIISYEDTVGIGDANALCVRETSIYIVHAIVPAPESSALARQFGAQIQAQLRYVTMKNDVRVINVSPPEPENLNDGLWTSYGVTVTTNYDHHVAIP